MNLLDSYARLIISYMKGRVQRLGGVALVPWFVRCFTVGSISRFMFFVKLVLL